jgi:hypothetical protein
MRTRAAILLQPRPDTVGLPEVHHDDASRVTPPGPDALVGRTGDTQLVETGEIVGEVADTVALDTFLAGGVVLPVRRAHENLEMGELRAGKAWKSRSIGFVSRPPNTRLVRSETANWQSNGTP